MIENPVRYALYSFHFITHTSLRKLFYLQILEILSEQKKLDKDSELSTFDPKNMIFVCNKWDIVNKRGENESTWRDTTRKLMRTIPGLTEDHIFKMSVAEVIFKFLLC